MNMWAITKHCTKMYTSVYDKYGRIIQAFGSEDIKQLALIEQGKFLEVNAEIA